MPMIKGQEFALGRVPSPVDVRDFNFPMAAPDVPLPPWKYHQQPAELLNQGMKPHCTAYSGCHLLGASPVRTPKTNAQADAYYWRCKAIDGYPGDGTYVRVMMKLLQDDGFISAYVWAHELDAIVRWVLLQGPVIVGTSWYDGMSRPDSKGVVHLTGSNVGGHAYMLRGASLARRQFRILNSWGQAYGQNGQSWIGFDDLWRLIRDEGGEAVAATEVLKVTA